MHSKIWIIIWVSQSLQLRQIISHCSSGPDKENDSTVGFKVECRIKIPIEKGEHLCKSTFTYRSWSGSQWR